MEQIDKIDEMLIRFVDGQTTEAEEQQLADFFHTADCIPEKWKSYQEMFLSFDSGAYAFSDQELDDMCTDVEDKDECKTGAFNAHHSWKGLKWGIAASIAIILAVGATAYHELSPSCELGAFQVSKTSNVEVKGVDAKRTPIGVNEKASVADSSKGLVAIKNKDFVVVRKTKKKTAARLLENRKEEMNIPTKREVDTSCLEDGNVVSCSSPFAIDLNIIDSEVPEYPERLFAQN